MVFEFVEDKRLGIALPVLYRDWETIEQTSQEMILEKWETIRGQIPDRIKELEEEIKQKLEDMSHEEDFQVTCRLNTEMAELASIINDLWIWYRTNQKVS